MTQAIVHKSGLGLNEARARNGLGLNEARARATTRAGLYTGSNIILRFPRASLKLRETDWG